MRPVLRVDIACTDYTLCSMFIKLILHCRLRLVRRWDGVLPAVLQPVALAIHFQMSTWWVRRSSNAPVRRSGPETSVHSSKGRLVVTRIVALAEDLEQQFRPGGGQGHEAQFVDDQQIEPRQLPCRFSSRLSSLTSISSCTRAVAVVNPTDIPRWQAASPSPRATWVLPVPLLSRLSHRLRTAARRARRPGRNPVCGHCLNRRPGHHRPDKRRSRPAGTGTRPRQGGRYAVHGGDDAVHRSRVGQVE